MFIFLLLLWSALFSPLSAQELEPIEIVLSFDDFPMGSTSLFGKVERAKLFSEKLARLKIQTIFFCIGEQLESEEGVAALSFVADDHILANHTYTHPHLSACSLEKFQQEIDKTDSLLGLYPNFRKWFRFAYLDYGDRKSLGGDDRKKTAAFQFLRDLGYQHGYVTINSFDWYVNSLLKKAIREEREVHWDRLKRAYLALMNEWIDAYHERWSSVLKRKFVHILLLHQNDLNALFLEDLVALIREKEWKIVSAEKAFQAPIPFLSHFANTGRIFKGVASLSIRHIEETLLAYEAFGVVETDCNRTGE